MYFNSLEFLIFFLGTLLVYWSFFQKGIKQRNLFLLVVSYFFYAYWDWRFLSLIFLSSAVDFVVGKQMDKEKGGKGKLTWLALSLLTNLGVLFAFKYFDFFASSAKVLLSNLGWEADFVTLNVVLPVGISFYTFQTLSYTIDVYRGKLESEKDPIAFFAFVSFFPQLVAGPIERAGNMLPQFKRKHTIQPAEASRALRQILWGLFKKVVIADQVADIVNHSYAGYTSAPASVLWLGAFYFAIEIYCDFSGYSDIAIGSARLMGFRLSENFRYPYFARSFRDFWKRWHISLSTWFRDYVYIPLGGRRNGISRAVLSLMLTFLLSGLWHGANWTFVVWGGLGGLYLIPSVFLRRKVKSEPASKPGEAFLNSVWSIPLVFVVTMFTWIFFRSESIYQAFEYMQNMFLSDWVIPRYQKLTPLYWIAILLVVEWFMSKKERPFSVPETWHPILRWTVYLVLCMSIARFFTIYHTFIYFQF